MKKPFILVLLFGIALVAIWGAIGYSIVTTELPTDNTTTITEDCDATEELQIAEAVDMDLITFDVTEDFGDIVVSYDGEEKIITTLTAGWHEGIEIIATDGDYAYVNIAPDGMGGYILYSGYYWVFRIDTSDWTYVQLPIDGFITDLNIEHQAAVMKDNVQGRTMMSVLDLNTFEKLSYSANSEYGQIGDGLLSPDGTKLAFAAAIGAPVDTEKGVIYVFDLQDNTKDIYAPVIEGIYQINGWIDNETLDYTF